MPDQSPLTVGDVAQVFGVKTWRARRVVDSLDVELPRAGSYRLIPRSLLGRIAVELERRGWLAADPKEPAEQPAMSEAPCPP